MQALWLPGPGGQGASPVWTVHTHWLEQDHGEHKTRVYQPNVARLWETTACPPVLAR